MQLDFQTSSGISISRYTSNVLLNILTLGATHFSRLDSNWCSERVQIALYWPRMYWRLKPRLARLLLEAGIGAPTTHTGPQLCTTEFRPESHPYACFPVSDALFLCPYPSSFAPQSLSPCLCPSWSLPLPQSYRPQRWTDGGQMSL